METEELTKMGVKELPTRIIDLENQLSKLKSYQANPYQALVDSMSELCKVNGYVDYGFKISKDFINYEPVAEKKEVSVWYKEKDGTVSEESFKDLDACLSYVTFELEYILKRKN